MEHQWHNQKSENFELEQRQPDGDISSGRCMYPVVTPLSSGLRRLGMGSASEAARRAKSRHPAIFVQC